MKFDEVLVETVRAVFIETRCVCVYIYIKIKERNKGRLDKFVRSHFFVACRSS